MPTASEYSSASTYIKSSSSATVSDRGMNREASHRGPSDSLEHDQWSNAISDWATGPAAKRLFGGSSDPHMSHSLADHAGTFYFLDGCGARVDAALLMALGDVFPMGSCGQKDTKVYDSIQRLHRERKMLYVFVPRGQRAYRDQKFGERMKNREFIALACLLAFLVVLVLSLLYHWKDYEDPLPRFMRQQS